MTSLIVSGFAILTAITFHNFGHAYASHLLGDDTAKNQGLMTADPRAHIDPIGFIFMVLFKIGFASHVPVNTSNFKKKNRKIKTVLFYLSGAASNLIVAIVCALLMKFIYLPAAQLVLGTVIAYNISFASFNLLPIPMLDGWELIKSFIPYKYYELVYKYESMSMFIFIVMVITNAHTIIMTPIYNVLMNIVYMFL